VFNLADSGEAAIRVEWKEIGLSGTCVVRDLWAREDLGTISNGFTGHVPPHGAVMLKVTQNKNGSK